MIDLVQIHSVGMVLIYEYNNLAFNKSLPKSDPTITFQRDINNYQEYFWSKGISLS